MQLADTFDPALHLYWSDDTDGTGSPSSTDIFSRVTKGFSAKQLASVQKVDTDDISTLCLQNFNGVSECFATVTFDLIPAAGSDSTLNYTIRVDDHLGFVNVKDHTSDYELRVLPLQWAIDSVSV